MMGALLATAIGRAEGNAPDLIWGASVKPVIVETTPKRPKRSRKVTVDEDESDLIAAK